MRAVLFDNTEENNKQDKPNHVQSTRNITSSAVPPCL